MHACVFIQATESAVATGCSRQWSNPFFEAARTFEAAISEVKEPSVATDCCLGSRFNSLHHFLEVARQERFKERLVE